MTDDELKSVFESCQALSARQLDQLIAALGAIRAQAQPAVQMMPDDLLQVTDDPALKFGIRSDGRLMLNLRSPAFGWQVFLLGDHNTAAIGRYFSNTAGVSWQENILTVHDVDRLDS